MRDVMWASVSAGVITLVFYTVYINVKCSVLWSQLFVLRTVVNILVQG
jgi:hypothetical protein